MELSQAPSPTIELFDIQWESALKDATIAWQPVLQNRPAIDHVVGHLRQTREGSPSAGDFCLQFVQAIVLIIGRATVLDRQQQRTIMELCREVEDRPFPALPWARFIAQRMDNLACLKEKVGRLSEDKRYLLAQISQRIAEEGATIGLHPGARVLVHGYSGVIPNVLKALPAKTKQTLRVFVTEQFRRQESEGRQFRDYLRNLDENFPQQHIEVVPDSIGLTMLQNRQIDTFVMSAKAIGLFEGSLWVINTFSPEGLVAAAKQSNIPILVISGRYKMWPEDLFAEHAQRVRLATVHHDALIHQEFIRWIATEGGAFTPKECGGRYEPWLAATMKTYPGWAPERMPSFFQDYSEDGLRLQVKWCNETLGLNARYFARLLRIEDLAFEQWFHSERALETAQQEDLAGFWRLHLHLRTIWGADPESVRSVYEYEQPSPERVGPPWRNSSIKTYLEANGREGIQTVQEWFESLHVPKAVAIPKSY